MKVRKPYAGISRNREALKHGRTEEMAADKMREKRFIDKLDQYLCIHGEKIKGRGEDSHLLAIQERGGVAAVFDGCGGSGAKVYPEFGNRKGAYLASRVLAESSERWFRSWCREPYAVIGGQGAALKTEIDRQLGILKERGETESLLLGSMSKEFPSTLAAAAAAEQKEGMAADFLWSGDSRGYILDADGLHQITVDDVANPDALFNLREDAGMTNVVSASHEYVIHERIVRLSMPCILLTATDGCFGYLKSPMEFEKLLLRTLLRSDSAAQWEHELDKEICAVAGDDYTMCMLLLGFGSFENLRDSLKKRWKYMEKRYRDAGELSEEELLSQWQEYKGNYETYGKNQRG